MLGDVLRRRIVLLDRRWKLRQLHNLFDDPLDPAETDVQVAGGNMVAVVTQLAKQRKGPAIRYQVLFYPVTDSSLSQKSYEEFANGPWLTTAAMKWFWDAYAPNARDRKKTTASPLSATAEQLMGLPPALVIVDENDPLRDEGEAYARRLMQSGVDVTAVRVLGTFHDFVMLNGLADTPASKGAIQLASAKLIVALNPLVGARP